MATLLQATEVSPIQQALQFQIDRLKKRDYFLYQVNRKVGIARGSRDNNRRTISNLNLFLSEECIMSEMSASLLSKLIINVL